ncbi:MAG: carboxypeptidase-like regulatory domain-containing protein [Burkholderiaceae bacterium]
MKFKSWLAASAAAVLLAACGGGSGGGSTETPAPTVSISGTAATGAPLANAAISLLCADGGPAQTATAGADGKYSLSIPATCAAPYMLKATAGDVTLYAFADAAGNINITPFTHMAAGIATNGNTAAEYAAVLAASKKVGVLWNSAVAEAATAKLKAKLAAMGVSLDGLGDFLHAAFNAKPGDKLDDALEALLSARGGVSLASLVEQVTGAGGAPGNKPWAALFTGGKTSVKYVASGCSVWPNDHDDPVTTTARATVTLSLSGDHLAISSIIEGVTPTSSVMLVGLTQTALHVGFAAGQPSIFLNASFRNAEGTDGGTLRVSGEQGIMGTPTMALYSNTYEAECETVESGPLRSEVNIEIAARVSSLISGTTTAITRECTSDTLSYTYSVTPLGDVKIDGKSILPNFANASLDPPWAYAEYNFFNGAESMHYTIMGRFPGSSSDNLGVSLLSQPLASPPVLSHYCGFIS